jgi:methyl-accepting chemotaxis protein
MFSMFGKSANPPGTPVAEEEPSRSELVAAIGSIAKHASGLGRESAEVRGLLEDTQTASTGQTHTLHALAQQIKQVTSAQGDISKLSEQNKASIARAREAVEEVAEGVTAVVTTLRSVSDVANGIAQIALQTRLVAFNASVEAKRAGEAGRGFGVVADAVKDLAGSVQASSKEVMATLAELDARIKVLAKKITPQSGDPDRGSFHQALADASTGATSIDEAAAESRVVCDQLNARMVEVEAESGRTGKTLAHAVRRSERFLAISEDLLDLVSHCGVQTEDSPFIAASQQAAAEIAQLLLDELDKGALTMEELFDQNYRPIANSNPPQFTTRFVPVADRLFPQVQERVLAMSDKVVFCIAVDRNGYVATHNQKYCQPQRGDLPWDTANSRYRRIFNDRTGLASARNERPFLLQTYRRDMGAGRFVVMKEAASPITIRGRHWGGLRLAFHF